MNPEQESELEPWIVLTQEGSAQHLALWQLADASATAVALFSSRDQAEHYASQFVSSAYQIAQPERHALLRILIECFQNQVTLAVLDPDQHGAKKIFPLRDVLRAAREALR